MSVLIKGMEMPKCCAECVAGSCEYNDNDERCFVCGFIKSQHPWECEHVEIDGIDTTKARADFCPLSEVNEKQRDSNGRFSSGLCDDWVYIEPLSGEEWKPIKGYEERYMISNMGRVRSRTKILKANTGNTYAQVILNNGDVRHRKTVTVHRLVAEAFVDNPLPNEYKYINHKDENKRNNKADNLEWCTAKYNLTYGKSTPIHNLKNYHSAPTVIEAEGET